MTYNGMFIREALGDTPSGTPPQIWAASPDVILVGTVPPTDPSVYASQDNYSKDYGSTLTSGQVNYIYVRALNTVNGPAQARLWLYYTDNNMAPFVDGWASKGIWVNGKSANYCTVSATRANQLVVSDAFVCNIPQPQSGQSYDLIVLVENAPLSDPPADPRPPNMTTWAELNTWAKQRYGRVGWRNGTMAPAGNQTWQSNSNVDVGNYSGELLVGVQAHNMLANCGHVSVTMPGPAGSNLTFAAQITSPDAIMVQQITVAQNFASTVTLTYWQVTQPPQGASLKPLACVPINVSQAE